MQGGLFIGTGALLIGVGLCSVLVGSAIESERLARFGVALVCSTLSVAPIVAGLWILLY